MGSGASCAPETCGPSSVASTSTTCPPFLEFSVRGATGAEEASLEMEVKEGERLRPVSLFSRAKLPAEETSIAYKLVGVHLVQSKSKIVVQEKDKDSKSKQQALMLDTKYGVKVCGKDLLPNVVMPKKCLDERRLCKWLRKRGCMCWVGVYEFSARGLSVLEPKTPLLEFRVRGKKGTEVLRVQFILQDHLGKVQKTEVFKDVVGADWRTLSFCIASVSVKFHNAGPTPIAEQGLIVEASEPKQPSWTCGDCTFEHTEASQQEFFSCTLCGAQRLFGQDTERRPAEPGDGDGYGQLDPLSFAASAPEHEIFISSQAGINLLGEDILPTAQLAVSLTGMETMLDPERVQWLREGRFVSFGSYEMMPLSVHTAVAAECELRALPVEFPSYWNQAVSDQFAFQQEPAPEDMFAALGSLLEATWKPLSLSRASSNDQLLVSFSPSSRSSPHKHVEVKEVYRNENPSLWISYWRERERIRQRCCDAQKVDTISTPVAEKSTAFAAIAADAELCLEAGEVYLFHAGPAPGASLTICMSDFRSELAGGSHYGEGVYLADCANKADAHATDDKGLFCLLLCRAVCGKAFHTSEARPDVTQLIAHLRREGYDSVIGEHERSREFVMHSKDQVYPEYIIFYRRTASPTAVEPTETLAETPAADDSFLAEDDDEEDCQIMQALQLLRLTGRASPLLQAWCHAQQNKDHKDQRRH